MVAALRRPAGKVTPILSSLSRSARPPFFDLALHTSRYITLYYTVDSIRISYLLEPK